MQLDPTAQAAGARLIAYDTIGSTNEEALRLARTGERAPLWIVARSQTGGRGRRGRAWVSEPGNLYASLLLADPSPPEHFPELSFVAALALHDAVTARVPGLAGRVALKWPNDLLIDRNKFAGILVEGEGTTVVIGIGVNCAHHPAGTEFPATDLAAAGVRATPDSLFPPLSGALTARLAQWDRGAGFAAIRADWISRAAGIGRPVRVRTGDSELAGTFEAIDASGRLVLRLPDGTMQAVAAGDVLMTKGRSRPSSTGDGR
ncbi:MAG: biotin--[acetyl-CoA-carboxylase] ligase [Xanthobacteraceae bacterium]|nr:biotin--[acetyl-CoA-carboxylase] ligase [Xanthobacteraceae bacterium]